MEVLIGLLGLVLLVVGGMVRDGDAESRARRLRIKRHRLEQRYRLKGCKAPAPPINI